MPPPARCSKVKIRLRTDESQAEVKKSAKKRPIDVGGAHVAMARESVIVDFAPIKESKIGEVAAKFDSVFGVTPSDG
jgi:hypothetical protein